MKLAVFCISLFLAHSVAVHSGQIRPQPVIFNFGDSLSDTGGYEAGTGDCVPWPYGRVFFNQPSGRMCDGRLVLDFLCDSLNITFLRPYLESLGQNGFNNGANFGIIGAGTLPRHDSYNLGVQISQFLRFRSRSLRLRSTGIQGYTDKDGFNNALYIIDIGGNDLSHAFKKLPYQKAKATVPKIIDEIRNAILKLREQGARNFWVPNSHPLGCLPLLLSAGNFTEADIDQYGCLLSLNDLIKIYNEKLQILCRELQMEFSNATVVYADIYSIRHELITNPLSYGLKYATTACCGHGGFPYNADGDDVSCGVEPYNVCANGAEYVSWDGLHYSEAANALTAAKILSAKYTTPPLSFDFFFTKTPASSQLHSST
ncbi:unnamed protein product [Rhodiola kirilowii]